MSTESSGAGKYRSIIPRSDLVPGRSTPSQESVTPSETPADGTAGWGRWRVEYGPAALAAYTSDRPAERLRFVQQDLVSRLHDSADAPLSDRCELAGRIAKNAFNEMAARQFRYATEADPWNAPDGQVIRDLYSMEDTFGTCLDLSLAFASICKSNYLRPLVVLLDGSPGHALVIVDLLSEWTQTETTWFLELNPNLSRYRPPKPPLHPRANAAVAVIGETATGSWYLGGRYVAVDIVLVTRPDASFASACEAGVKRLDAALHGSVVDVGYAIRLGVAEILPPDDRHRSALHADLPVSGGSFEHYPSRRAVEERLRDLRGMVVLLGDAGAGKSALARQVARRLSDGCGWWLDGSSGPALRASLAIAEAREQGLNPGTILENEDVTNYARLARRRLSDASGPWVVVLDNADDGPDDCGEQMVADPGRGQLLLVTSTNQAWRTVRDAHVEELEPLSDVDLVQAFGAGVPKPALAAIAGRPLLLDASLRFREHAGRPWWELSAPRTADAAAEAPERIWEAVQASLGSDSEACRIARAISLLPPVPFPTPALHAVTPNPATAVRNLHVCGLIETARTPGALDSSVPSLTMHRLFRAALRGSAADRERIALASSILNSAATTEVLAGAYDLATVRTLRELVGAPSRAADHRAADLHVLGLATERHAPDFAAACFEQALDLLDWSPGDATGHIEDAQRLLVVDALRALARPLVKQKGQSGAETKGRLERAIPMLLQAEELCRHEGSEESRLARARTNAMHGIALREYAALFKSVDLARARELLAEAEALLRSSHDDRRQLMHTADRPDVDRSQFNLAGLEIQLAQVDDPERASSHLDNAWRHYEEVHRVRSLRYRKEEVEDVVTCVNGLALVDYYRATLLDLDDAAKVRALRSATERAVRAIDVRARLQGDFDGPDAAKSMALATKILLARLATNRSVTGKGDDAPETMADFGREWHGLALASTWVIGTDGSADVVAAPRDVPAAFEPVAPVGSGADLRSDILSWTTSAPVRALVAAFAADGEAAEVFVGAQDDLAGFLARLDAFTDRWDTRRGQERNLAAELALTPRQAKLALVAARALGLRDPGRPRHRRYDHVLVLGGLIRACFARTAHGARLLRRGDVETGSVVALGAPRPLAGDETLLALQAGLPALAKDADEFDAVTLGTRRAFRLDERERREERVAGGDVRRYQGADGLRIVVAAAPPREPEKDRANTADAYAWFGTHLAQLQPGQRLLAITTDIYRPQQHAAALGMLALPYGVEVDTVGHVPASVEPVFRQSFSSATYLMEIRATIRALRRLLEETELRC